MSVRSAICLASPLPQIMSIKICQSKSLFLFPLTWPSASLRPSYLHIFELPVISMKSLLRIICPFLKRVKPNDLFRLNRHTPVKASVGYMCYFTHCFSRPVTDFTLLKEMEWSSLECRQQILLLFTKKCRFLNDIKWGVKISSFYLVNIKHPWSRIFEFSVIFQSLKPFSRSSMNFTECGPFPAFSVLLSFLQKNLGTDTYLPTQQHTFSSSSLIEL